MSSLSFLSKKSWHTGLQSNQEAVWKAEKHALEERKKLDELRKERERERELEELERLNVESGGKQKRRQERVDWMYQVPASISSMNDNSTTTEESNKEELEEYLLGKKRVDKLLTKGDQIENNISSSRHGSAPQANPGSTSSAGMAIGGGDANSDRDLASKIREDPTFAIRQQEQAAYQALLKDPARLRAMRKAAGMDVEKSESKEERRRRKEERRRRREEDEDHRDRHHHSSSRRSDSRSYRDDEDRSKRRRDEEKYSGRSEYDRRSRYGRDDYEPRQSKNRSYRDEHDNNDKSRRSRSPYSSRQSERRDKYARSPSPKRSSYHENRNNHSSRQYTNSQDDKTNANTTEIERQLKLEAMQKNAKDLTNSRNEYLTKIKEKEDEDLAREEALRLKVQQSRRAATNGFGKEVKGSFLLEQERSLYGGGSGEKIDLAERLRRGRDTFQRFEND